MTRASGENGLRRHARGLTLVELLVTLVIGLLTIVAVVGLMSNYSGPQRAAQGASDAQKNALVGLHAMEQDLRMAGLGLAANAMQNCDSPRTFYGDSTATAASPIADFSTAALRVIDGGSGADTVIARFAEGVRGVYPLRLMANAANNAASISVDTTFGVFAGDLLLLVSGSSNCALRRVTNVDAGTQVLALASAGAQTYNPPSAVATGSPAWPAFASGDGVFALGRFTMRRYSVTAEGLAARDMHATTDTPIAADIVDLQAQYGIADSAAGTAVTGWVSAVVVGGTDWSDLTVALRKRIRAVRIAVVARSAERDQSEVSPATLELWPQATTGQLSDAQSYTVPDRHFRYRVLRTVIPMKNLLWAGLS